MTLTGFLARLLAAACLGMAGAAAAGPAELDADRLHAEPAARPWSDATGRPTANALVARALIAGAADDGLDPADYRVPETADPAAAERALSVAVLRWLRDLHLGRVDPREIGFRLASRQREHDFAALLAEALATQRLPELAAALRPAIAPYRALREALPRYRALAADAALPPVPALPRGTKKLQAGEDWEGTPALRARLLALGDLPSGTAPGDEPRRYDDTLADAVQRFQARHGLDVDGVIGAGTLAALQVSPARRVRQIELALERLRWLPHLDAPRGVAVNIPMFRLRAWDAADPARGLGMAVIVGKALNTRTPVFVDEMTHLIFRPYWNVPRSIVRHEVLPGLARDPGYLARHGLEIVRGPGDDAVAVAPSAANVALLRDGVLRLRQPPGPKNSLGLVKFVFPNDADVYLHGTPAQQLFGRARRDFSHGCVRVEDPVALAEWLLRGQPGWDRAAIVAAMNGTRTRRVDLAAPLPVVLYDLSATVSPDDGRLHFAADLYGHDARLEAALAKRRR